MGIAVNFNGCKWVLDGFERLILMVVDGWTTTHIPILLDERNVYCHWNNGNCKGNRPQLAASFSYFQVRESLQPDYLL